MNKREWFWAITAGANTGMVVLLMWWYPPTVLALFFGISAVSAFKSAMWARDGIS